MTVRWICRPWWHDPFVHNFPDGLAALCYVFVSKQRKRGSNRNAVATRALIVDDRCDITCESDLRWFALWLTGKEKQ